MGSPPRRLPPKKDVMLGLLEKSGVFLHIDPRRDGVLVPQGFKQQPELVLQVGLNMAVPIRDLEVDDEGVSCTLSFNRRPFWCRMPWPSIYAIVSDEDRRGVVWPEDVPRESKMSSAQAQPPAPKRPKLRAVRDDEQAPSDPTESGEDLREAPQGAGTCGGCGTRWVEDQESCPLCGATRREAFRPEGEATETRSEDEPAAATPAAEAPAAAPSAPPALAAVPAQEEPASTKPSTPPSEPPPEGGKPKRQLPPYLRIVK